MDADRSPASAAIVARVAGREMMIASAADRLAHVAFGLAIVLSPLRAQILLAARPMPPLYAGYTDLTISWSGIAVLATLGCWLVALAASRRPVLFGPAFVRWPAVVLLAAAWLTVPSSSDPLLSAFDAARLTVLAAFALYVLNEVRGIADLSIPVAVMAASQGTIAIAQSVMQRSVGLGGLGELSLDPLKAGTSVVSATGTDRLLRAYGLADHPNILGGVLAAALPILVVGFLQVRSRATQAGTGRRPVRFVALALAAGLDAAALFLTFSRGAWLAVAAGLAVGTLIAAVARRSSLAGSTGRRPSLAASTARRPRALALASMVVLAGGIAVAVVAATGLGRYVAARAGLDGVAPVTEQMSIGERPILVAAAAEVFIDHPLTGAGLGALPIALHAANPSLTFDSQPAPNVAVDAAAETGALGGLAYLALLVAPWVALVRRRLGASVDLAVTTAVLVAIDVVGLFDYYTWSYPAGLIWAWLAIGLWTGAFGRATSPSAVTDRSIVWTSWRAQPEAFPLMQQTRPPLGPRRPLRPGAEAHASSGAVDAR